MAKITGEFKLQLEVGKVVIAESDDKDFCLSVLQMIQQKEKNGVVPILTLPVNPEDNANKELDLIQTMADELGTSKDELIGACDPKTTSPYITFDVKYWQALKKNTGLRGPKAISAIVLSLSILNIWFKIADLGLPTQKIGSESLKLLHVVEKNKLRAINNCDWLQLKSDNTIVINPAKYDMAVNLVKKYVTQSYE